MPNSAQLLRKAMAEPTSAAYRLIREDVLDGTTVKQVYQMRMWRTDHRLQFEGLIHEYVPPHLFQAIVGNRKIYDLPVKFGHDGYVGGLSREKLLRNEGLLRRELELRPGRLYFQIDLARTLIELGDPEGRAMIADLLDSVLSLPESPAQECVADLLVCGLEMVPDSELRSVRCEMLVQRSLEWHPNNPAVLWALAQFEKRRGNPGEARSLLKRLRKLLDNRESMLAFGMSNTALVEVDRVIAELTLEADSVR
jgi:hypothetical protein